MISFESVNFTLGERTIFTQLDASFSKKGISFLVGANGSGKTQLLRLIHGLATVNSGKLITPPKNQQAFLTQNPVLLSRTVEENLRFIRGCPSCSSAHFDENFDTVVQYFGIQNWLSQQVMRLSGGQQKRIAIARLFLQQATHYLIDEPSANVDYHTNLRIESAIGRLVEEDKKVIVASHDWVQIERMFNNERDEILVLYEGEIVARNSVLDFQQIKSYL